MAAHEAPPILSAAQEADAEAAYVHWRDDIVSQMEDSIPSRGFAMAYGAWLAAWRACRHATLIEVERQREDVAKIACGASHPDPAVEARFAGLREAAGQRTDGGCGRPMAWTNAYRCLECGRFFSASCLRAHFAQSGQDAAKRAKRRANGGQP